jgi:outer membrane protein OmpA-like peptidoglycan-associated protein
LVLGAIALVLILALSGVLLWSLRQLNRQVAQVSELTGRLNRRVETAEQQSQSSAQQASQAAASAQAAAQQRDEAKQSEEKAAAEAQSALQAAAAAQAQASAAEIKTVQQVLGQIAETHRTALGLVMTLGEKSIRFDFDKSDIDPQYRDILNRIAGVLLTLKGYSIYVYGYTDDVGTEEYNLKLSERRAQAVRDSLVKAGIDRTLIATRGFGKSDPRAKGDTTPARAANRRVEIGIVDSTLVFSDQPLPEK